MFNLKKFGGKKKALETSEKQLYKERKEMGTEGDDDAGTTNQRLDSVRKDPDGDETTELQMDDVRSATDVTEGRTTDGQLGHHKTPDGYEPLRADTEKRKFYGIPVNELDLAHDAELSKALEKSDSLDADTKFWDKTFGKEESIALAPSQLHNHPDRVGKLTPENVANDPQLKEMVIASLKDADAMLFHIYHTAAINKRELNTVEQSLVDGISQDKVKIAFALGMG